MRTVAVMSGGIAEVSLMAADEVTSVSNPGEVHNNRTVSGERDIRYCLAIATRLNGGIRIRSYQKKQDFRFGQIDFCDEVRCLIGQDWLAPKVGLGHDLLSHAGSVRTGYEALVGFALCHQLFSAILENLDIGKANRVADEFASVSQSSQSLFTIFGRGGGGHQGCNMRMGCRAIAMEDGNERAISKRCEPGAV